MMKLISKVVTDFIVLIVLIYASLLGYMYYTDSKEVRLITNLKSIYSRVQSPHSITVLTHGLQSFKSRLELIRNAKESLELEFFIYELDEASKMITFELIKAAQRGVKVKILVDYSIAVFKLEDEYAQALLRQGIDIRYYNTVSNSNFIAVQHRNHRKLLIADQKRAITGGRNIANEYFDLHRKYNFLDYDIEIEGEIVANMRESFFQYWESSYASKPEPNRKRVKLDFFGTGVDKKLEQALNSYEIPAKFECHDVAYSTDFPGVLVTNRQVYKRIEEIVKSSKQEVVVESPYFVLREDGAELIRSITKEDRDFHLLTNSLRSTDAFYTTAAMALKANLIKSMGIDLYLFKGESPYKQESIHQDAGWGIHSKRAVIDEKHTIVGTYNIDPRSANLNSEMIIVCRDNPELAKFVKEDILKRSRAGIKIENYSFSEMTKNAPFSSVIKFYLSMPLVYFLEFLL